MRPVDELLKSNDDALVDDEIAKRNNMIKQLRREVYEIEQYRYRITTCKICGELKKSWKVELILGVVTRFPTCGTLYLCEGCIANLTHALQTKD